ncbi:MAG: hypothetical protein GC179_26405 [Anaerolineaceae bacterium]|nr:hypothetical protein [Anaerolineaceae bacterium]
MDLEDEIREIGVRMVGCSNECAGINRQQVDGILPRCLFLETTNRQQGQGTVVVGINPGRSGADEQKFYQEQGQTYEQTVAYWDENLRGRHPYYKRLRELIDKLELSGSILWTELVKCENHPKQGGLPPLQTFRTCTSRYLQSELKIVPVDWPIMAIGLESYRATAYMFPERIVIGVPHPTGSFGRQFHRLLDPESVPIIKEFIAKSLGAEEMQAVWIPELIGQVIT